MKTNKFIVLAGCEGGGKTTQIGFLKEEFPEAVFTREPGGTEFAEKGPRYLMFGSPYAEDLNGYEQITQAFSGRSHHIRNLIEPSLADGKTVISDRFDCCSFAYQIYGMESSHLESLFFSLRDSLRPKIVPDLYIILDIDPAIGMKRVAERKAAQGDNNHFDRRGQDFHARVREGYAKFALLFPESVKIIDANRSREEVRQSILDIIKQ